jgi:hypothetical protein
MAIRKKIWPASADLGLERFREQLYDRLCRHLVCLGIRFTHLDTQGNSDGKEHIRLYSCFVVSIKDKWFLVTAGHVFEELDKGLRKKAIRIESSFLADFFGQRSAVRSPTPFSYEDAPKHYIVDTKLGLDFGFILLRDLFRDGLLSNGIVPIPENHRTQRQEPRIDVYWMLGFPSEVKKFEPLNKPINGGEVRVSEAAPVIISAEKIDDESQIPSSVTIEPTKFPRFIGRINAEIQFNIQGMSGGPIFGLTETADGMVEYTVVAIQSSWYQESRIIFGCLLRVVGEFISRHKAGHPMTRALDRGTA